METLEFWEVAQRLHLDLPAGYVRTSEEEEEGFKIRSGASVDDDGEVTYKFLCDAKYITADAEPGESVYDIFDEMITAFDGAKGITLEEFPETALSIREFHTAQ